MKVVRTIVLGLLLGSVLSLNLKQAHATGVHQAIETTGTHVAEERFGQAIRAAEGAADRGSAHPDLSFNRGLAYLRRAQSTTAEPGDLGQAAAGFAEALQLRAGDAEAERGLNQVQLLVAQDRSKSDASPESTNLRLIEQVLLGIPGLLLLILGTVGSLLVVTGVFMRRSKSESRRATGGITALIGLVLLAPSFGLASAQHLLFRQARVAVVIADQAEVVDSGGGRITGRQPYREGTLLHIGPIERGMAPLINFGPSSKVPAARLRVLAQPGQ